MIWYWVVSLFGVAVGVALVRNFYVSVRGFLRGEPKTWRQAMAEVWPDWWIVSAILWLWLVEGTSQA